MPERAVNPGCGIKYVKCVTEPENAKECRKDRI